MSDHEIELQQISEQSTSRGALSEGRFGFIKPSVLSEASLPTKLDIIRRVCLGYDDKLADENKSEVLQSFVPDVVHEILLIWKKTRIPILSEKGVTLKIKRLIEDYKKKKRNKNRDSFKVFYDNGEKLFDIARCKCVRNNCKCADGDRIPIDFIDFIFDQRGDRQLRLTELPEPTTEISSDFLATTEIELGLTGSEYIPGIESVEYFTFEHAPKRFYNRQRPMPHLATECDRYGVSNRAAAALVSAAFKDYEIQEAGQPVIIDPSKIERERVANRKNIIEKSKSSRSVIAFSFDGRTDKTKTQHKTTDGKLHPRMIKEKHVTVLRQPQSQFLGYIADLPEEDSEKTAAQITAQHLLNFFGEKYFDLTNLMGVCTDGEVKNTGRHDGIVRTLEKSLGIPLHWFICLLHFAELCLRHVSEKVDNSRTTGPKTGTGQISKEIVALENLEGVDMPVVNFRPIPIPNGRLPQKLDSFKLSTDEKYLYEISMAVSTGQFSEQLANKKVPPLHEARWMTKACRQLRLYVTKERPSKNLQDLVKFIMYVYVPTYFSVKHQYWCTHGSIHFFNVIKYSLCLEPRIVDVIKETCRNNPYFAHSENILLAMIYDPDVTIRKLGYERILRSRHTVESIEEESDTFVRLYCHPQILFHCGHYYDMIDWNLDYTEPPFTRNLSFEEVTKLAETGEMILDDFRKVPCHSQATERHVKLVAEMASRFTTHERREGAIATTIEGRKSRPKFDSKKDFV